jgi:hypothetical protein
MVQCLVYRIHQSSGHDALRGGLSTKTDDGAVRSLQIQMKDQKPKKTNWKDPLANLMKQLGLKPGVDIDSVALNVKQARLATPYGIRYRQLQSYLAALEHRQLHKRPTRVRARETKWQLYPN